MNSNQQHYFSNPFADTAADPFQDPSIEAARNSKNNFTLRTSEDSPPLENVHLSRLDSNSYPNRFTQDRERELMDREAQLEARERSLQEQEERLRRSGIKPANFPFFYPIYYMDINEEIPPEHQDVVRRLYQSWLAFMGILVINLITAILFWTANPSNLTSTSTNFFSALSYALIMPFPSFFLWYRPIYNAYMKERALYFFIFFFFNFFHILYLIYMVVGIPGTGSCGVINTLFLLGDGKIFATIFGFITIALFGSLALAGFYLFTKAHNHCKQVGHTFSDAKGEAFSKAANSQVARNAAGEYVRHQYGA